MATLLIQQPDGHFAIFTEETATFAARDMSRSEAGGKVMEMLGWVGWTTTPVGAINRLSYLFQRAEADKGQWPAARERVLQVHGPDAAEWMRALDRQAAIDAFNNATARLDAARAALCGVPA